MPTLPSAITQYTIFIVLAPPAAIVSIVLGVYAWRQYNSPGTSALAWLMLTISGWLVFNTLELVSLSETFTVMWAKMTYFFITAAPVAWLAFALQYTGRNWWLKLPRFLLFWIIPLATTLLVQTNEYHGLVWRSYTLVAINNLLAMRVTYGPWFWVNAAYSYGLVLVGSYAIIAEHFTAARLYRQQSKWLLIGALCPLVFNIVYIFRLIPGFTKDFSSVAFALAGLAYANGIFRFRLFDLKPIARNALVDSMADAMLVLDERWRIIDLNPAAQAVFGIPRDEAIGLRASQALAIFEDRAECTAQFLAAQAEIVLQQNGKSHTYDLRTTPLHDRRGQLSGWLLVLRDITLRKQADAEREQLIAELDAFAHTVAHDLKNPLQIIAGYAALMLEDPAVQSESLREYMDGVLKGALKATTIVDELLLLSGVRTAGDVAKYPLDMRPIVADACQRLEPLIVTTQAELHIPEAWPVAAGHAPWVEEIWVNYLSNALKYGGSPPRIELGADSQDGQVRFWVRDSGPGLTPQEQATVFLPFTRLSRTQAEGHGLGLSIVQRIVSKLGGEAGVESTAGEGSCFYFTLPAADSKSSSQLAAQPGGISPHGELKEVSTGC